MTGQAEFTAALLDSATAPPTGLSNPDGSAAAKRFDVYRNNVAVSLAEALATGFPILEKLVGEEFFRAMAGVYLRAHPPQSPLMMHYGADMPRFLSGFAPVAHLPYLPDIARLEIALRESYHAADAAPVSLDGLAPEALVSARLTLAPALRLVRSPWPIHGIWRVNTYPGAPRPGAGPEDVLVTRPEFDPEIHLLPTGGAAFVAAIAAGAPLSAAAEAAGQEAADFDLTATLGLLLAGNAITGID